METVQVKNKYREERNAYLLGTLSSSFKNLESSIRSSKGVFENTINRSNWRQCIAVVVTGYDKLRQAGYDKCFQGSHIRTCSGSLVAPVGVLVPTSHFKTVRSSVIYASEPIEQCLMDIGTFLSNKPLESRIFNLL